MSRTSNPYRRAGSWVTGTGWTSDPSSEQAQGCPRPGRRAAEPADELRHGYTLADLDRMARASTVADRLMVGDMHHRYDTAWSAIVEALYAAEVPPERQHLIRVGWQAIYREVRDGHRQHGYSDSYDGSLAGSPDMPRFALYWGRGWVPSHEDAVVERIGARQLLGVLTSQAQRDAVLALAAHDDYAAAARSLGIRYTTLTVRLSTARRQLAIAWCGGETPARTRHTDRRVEVHGAEQAATCHRGHPWTPENTRIRRSAKGRTCRACERDRDRLRRGGAR